MKDWERTGKENGDSQIIEKRNLTRKEKETRDDSVRENECCRL